MLTHSQNYPKNFPTATEGPRRIYTRLVSNLPNATQVGSQLDVNMMIVPSFGFLARTGDVWTPLTELQFGDIRDNGELRRCCRL